MRIFYIWKPEEWTWLAWFVSVVCSCWFQREGACQRLNTQIWTETCLQSLSESRVLTQTRLTPHHITLKGPYCGFACVTQVRPSLHYCGPFFKAQCQFLDFFFLLSFGFNSCQYGNQLAETSCPSQWTFSQLYSFDKVIIVWRSRNVFKNHPLWCVQGTPQGFENQRPQRDAFMRNDNI